jgi:Tfp pilus assembly protein PilP
VTRLLLVIALCSCLGALPALADEIYDPIGKRDPFRSPLIRDPELPPTGGTLAQWQLSQLTLVAIAGSDHGRFALVEPPQGSAALLTLGTRLGKERAEVVLISSHHVVVRQERRLLTGSLIVDLELRLAGPTAVLPLPAPGP